MKKIFVLLLTVCLFFLTACSGGVDYFEYTDINGEEINQANIYINSSYALSKGISAQYFYSYVSSFLSIVDYKEINNANREARFSVSAVANNPTSNLAEFTVSNVKDNFFFYTVSAYTANPFKQIYDSFETSGKTENKFDKSFGAVLARGYSGDDVMIAGTAVNILPFYDYFYMLAGDKDKQNNVALDFYKQLSIAASNGSTVQVDEQTFYMWSSSFSSNFDNIEILYYRPNTLGFNIVAIALGIATVAIIYLITKKPKRKETLLDVIPYNPNDIDPFDNLPSK